MNTLKQRVFKAIVMLSLLSMASLYGQNLITNGDFEAGNTGFITDYTHYPSGGMFAGCYCIDNTVNGHGESSGFLPPNGSSGKYMIVNGFGGNNNQDKVVWRQTVNVTSNTWYTFSFKYANLSRIFLWYGEGAILRFLINGPLQDVNDIQLNAGDNAWHTYPNYRWYSGNVAGQIYIEFRDVFDGSPGDGDDFALDNISFVPDVVYSVNAQDDYVTTTLCLNEYVDVDVLQNDNVLPNTNDAQVQVITDPIPHGTAGPSPLDSKKIRYTFTDANYNGEVQFNYRVTNHGVVSEATVHINTARPPTISNINLPSTIDICEGDPLTLPTPTVTENGSTITLQGWQVLYNGSWQPVNGNTIPSVTSGYTNVRYYAENQCTPPTIYSEEFQIVVNDEPTVGSISNIIPASVCAPYTFSSSPPSIDPHGSDLIPSGCGWQMQINGQWVPVPNPIEYQHNGCSIRYHAENGCGSSTSNVVQLTVNDIPIVGSITAPAAICAGGAFNLTTPSVTWRHNDPSTYSEGWEIQINGVWQPLPNNNIPYAYNGCSIRYKAHNGCCEEGEYIYSNQVAVTVYSTEPTYEDLAACDTYIWNGVTCDHTGTYQAQVQNENGCTITAYLNFTMSDAYTETQTYSACESFTWPINGQTYYATGTDTYTIESGNPLICDSIFTLNLTINHPPMITEQLESPNPIEVCSSVGALNVTAPSFENGGTTSWEYATSENGPWNNGFNPASFNLEYGSYWLRYVVDNDCADVPVTSNPVPFYVSEAPAVSIAGGQQLHDLEICYGEVMDWPQVLVEWKCQPDGLHIRRWEKASEQYGTYAPFDTTAVISNDCWIRYYVQNSCGEVVLGPVQVSVLSVQDEWQSHEDCDMVEFEGVQYVEDTVINVMVNEPCPHTIHHNIIVHHSEYTMEPIPQTTCHDEFVWHGHTYYRSDGLEQLMHFDTLTEYGCNKTLEQQLVFDDYSTKIESKKACGTYYWPRNDSTYVYDESHIHIQDSWFIPGDGVVCDSIIYLSLDLGRDYELQGEPIEPQCYGFEWHGVPYYEDAIVYDSLKTAITQCDSIISYRLTIVQPFDTVVEMENCKPVWWQDHLFEEDGEEFTATLISSLTGCDSIVTMHFSLTPEIVKQLDTLACEAFSWYGHYFSENGQASHTFLTPAGCDSTVYLNVSFLQADILDDEPVSACNSYTFHGITYGPGIHEIYHDTVFAPNGCISEIQLLNLTVKDSEQMGTISGASSVYVASNLISGIYRYEIDMTGLTDSVSWSLSNSDWQIVESGSGVCRVLVTTPGTAILTARFQVEECGEMERTFVINAGFFDVEEMEDRKVQVYPNPTKGTVHIEAEGIESIRLTNMMGQVLEMREFGRADSLELNLSGYVPSVYLLEIKTAFGVVKRRVVVCR